MIKVTSFPVEGNSRWYRKRPVVIAAIQMDDAFEVETLEGTMTGSAGDFLIRGVQLELYPCKKEIFEQTYEEVGK